jgi:hypothetical protein
MEVNVSQAAQVAVNGSTAYTTSSDFCRIFAEETNGLFTLALLLTADPEKAEKCFVAGLENCVEGNAVFKEWARSWSRRAVIQHAIQMVAPLEGSSRKAMIDVEPRLRAVLNLDKLERFVFVMSVLEGYSNQDCAILLGCTRQAVMSARARALDQIASADEINRMQTGAIENAHTHLSN